MPNSAAQILQDFPQNLSPAPFRPAPHTEPYARGICRGRRASVSYPLPARFPLSPPHGSLPYGFQERRPMICGVFLRMRGCFCFLPAPRSPLSPSFPSYRTRARRAERGGRGRAYLKKISDFFQKTWHIHPTGRKICGTITLWKEKRA